MVNVIPAKAVLKAAAVVAPPPLLKINLGVATVNNAGAAPQVPAVSELDVKQ